VNAGRSIRLIVDYGLLGDDVVPLMPDDVDPPDVAELGVILSMSASLRAGERLDPQRVERALEAGFGALMGLEAALSRAQRNSREAPDAGAAQIEELHHRITELRDALTDLRTLTGPPGDSRVGYGFVLPAQGQRFHAHRN
jgi:hypothetical protein